MTTLPSACAISKSGSLNLQDSSGPITGLDRECFTFGSFVFFFTVTIIVTDTHRLTSAQYESILRSSAASNSLFVRDIASHKRSLDWFRKMQSLKDTAAAAAAAAAAATTTTTTTPRGMWHIWWKAEVRTGFWWGNLRGRDHLEDPGGDGRIILRCIFRKWDVGA